MKNQQGKNSPQCLSPKKKTTAGRYHRTFMASPENILNKKEKVKKKKMETQLDPYTRG